MKIITDITKEFDEKVLIYLPIFKCLNDKCTGIKNIHLEIRQSEFNDIPEFLHFDLLKEKLLQFGSGIKK
jgi:hypothetical protein